MNVVRNMVHIWIGPRNPPKKWMQTWEEHHADWNYRVLNDAEYRRTEWRLQHLMDAYYADKLFNGVADMIRYETLLREGGFMPPADSICYHAVDELLTKPAHYCYSMYENEEFRPGYVSPIHAANPGNAFLQIIVDELESLKPSDLSRYPWESTGNAFLERMIAKHKPDIKIWPSHYFIPKHYDRWHARYNGPDKIYAEQLWGSTANGKSYDDGI